MVLIQDLSGLLKVEIILGHDGPGHLNDPVQISPHHGGLGGIGMHLVQSLELASGLLLNLFGHLRLFDLLPEGLDLVGALIHLTQFASNRPHLLSKKIFPLRFGHFFFGLRLNLGLHGEDLHLFSKKLVHCLEPFHGIKDF